MFWDLRPLNFIPVCCIFRGCMVPSGEGRYRNSKEAPSPGTLQVADIYSDKRKGKKPLESVTEHLVHKGLCFLLNPELLWACGEASGGTGSWRVTWVPDGEEERVLSSQGDPPEGDGKSDQSWLDTSVLGNPIRWLQRKPKRPNFCSLSRDGRHVGGSPWPQANSIEGWQASWKKKKLEKKVSNSTWGVKKFYLLSRVFPFLTEV